MLNAMTRALFLAAREERISAIDLGFDQAGIVLQGPFETFLRSAKVSRASETVTHVLQMRDAEAGMRGSKFRIAFEDLGEAAVGFVEILAMARAQQKAGEQCAGFQILLGSRAA